jgi:hypothetical protein
MFLLLKNIVGASLSYSFQKNAEFPMFKTGPQFLLDIDKEIYIQLLARASTQAMHSG